MRLHTGLRALVAPGYPLLLLCLLAATRPDRAEGDPTGDWGWGGWRGEGYRCTGRGSVAATLQPDDIPGGSRRGRRDAGAGGYGAERGVAFHWLGAGYPRRKRGSPGGSAFAGYRVILSQ